MESDDPRDDLAVIDRLLDKSMTASERDSLMNARRRTVEAIEKMEREGAWCPDCGQYPDLCMCLGVDPEDLRPLEGRHL